MRSWFLANGLTGFVALWLLLTAPAVFSYELTITPTDNATTLAPGDVFAVTGFVTNITQSDLLTTELFLSFSGYPADKLTLNQLLGIPEFTLFDREVSAELDLFSIGLLPDAVVGEIYSFEFFAMDINGIFSNVSHFAVTVRSASTDISEPSAVALLGVGLVGLMFLNTVCRRVAPRLGENDNGLDVI